MAAVSARMLLTMGVWMMLKGNGRAQLMLVSVALFLIYLAGFVIHARQCLKISRIPACRR